MQLYLLGATRQTFHVPIFIFNPALTAIVSQCYYTRLECRFNFISDYYPVGPITLQYRFKQNTNWVRGSCKKFCHWVRITSSLRIIKHIFITNLQSIPPLLKHIFVTFLPSSEKQINSLLLVSVGDTDK